MSSPSIDRRLGLTGNKAYKAPCDLATTANVTLSGEQVIDGTLTSSSRVLVWVQNNNVDNGIWDTSSGSWSRAIDCNTNQDIAKGTQVLVTGGTSYAGQIFEFTSANPIIPGTSAITIVRGISSSTLEARLASTASASDNAGLLGFLYSLVYAASTTGWGIRTAARGYNVLRHVTPSQWAAIFDGTSTDDHSAAIIAGIAAATAAKQTPYFPGARWNYYFPVSAIDLPYGMDGDGPSNTSVYVDLVTYSGVVFRQTNAEVRNITIRERNLIKTRGTLLQMAANPISGFTGYTKQSRVFVFGGSIALDIQNAFACTYTECRYEQAATGVKCIPDTSAGGGYVTTQTFIQCNVTDNTQNWNVNPTTNSDGFVIIGGSTERPGATTSIFNNVREMVVQSHYCEGSSGVVALTLGSVAVDINGIYLNGTAGLSLGTNCKASIKKVTVGSSTDVLTCTGATQELVLADSTWPASGNTFDAANTVMLGNVTINGTTYKGYRGSETAGASGRRSDATPQVTVVSGASATDVYRFVNLQGTLVNHFQSGKFQIFVGDASTGANAAVYEYRLESLQNGTTSATLTQIARKVDGTDPGISSAPFTLVNDGAGGAVKLQFQKNAAIASVNVKVIYDGLSCVDSATP